MATTDNSDELKAMLREKINELLRLELLTEPFVKMSHVSVSETLVASAFAWRDFNGGIDDTDYAAECLHRVVNEEAATQKLRQKTT